jgi:hypothetical protein
MEVSKDLSDAFRQAILQLDAWRPPSPEPTVPYGREYFSATGLCGFLNNEHFASSRMPDELIESILRLKKVDPNHMLTDYTFQGAARISAR